MNFSNLEWLVADQKGFFAMGTPQGFRLRKYHGFYLGIPGRSETAFLVDLDFEMNGKPLWPHLYLGPEGILQYPNFDHSGIYFTYQSHDGVPLWIWTLEDGVLSFQVKTIPRVGVQLSWAWRSNPAKKAHLKIRGLWGMRDLHSLGGQEWSWKQREPDLGQVSSLNGRQAFCTLQGLWSWIEDPTWYQSFYYPEEAARGYPANENLFSAGILELVLNSGQTGGWLLTEDLNHLFDQTDGSDFLPSFHPSFQKEQTRTSSPFTLHSRKGPVSTVSRLSDFILTRPPGIVAGFPWFGEWGRDTWIALPGLVGQFLGHSSSRKLEAIESWSVDLLRHWGRWIQSHGMLPNLIGNGGQPQWEAADSTLWWCHALTALWTYSLCPPFLFKGLVQEFHSLLNLAISSIQEGRHSYLRVVREQHSEGLLEVTASDPSRAYTTWMDARIGGKAVTPRLGTLPEINALWFEARTLQWLWKSKSSSRSETSDESGTGVGKSEMAMQGLGSEALNELDENALKELGSKVLRCQEADRPNPIFLHSLPLAPSFVLEDRNALEKDLAEIAEKFWTPVGLRTLSPSHPSFKPRCIGDHEQRDRAYHQGPVWAWLGGHFEMARQRQKHEAKVFQAQVLEEMPIQGHIAEIFDAEPPYTPRGAPAQAWSLACHEEARVRKRMQVDARVTRVLAQRWLDRKDRRKIEKRFEKKA